MINLMLLIILGLLSVNAEPCAIIEHNTFQAENRPLRPRDFPQLPPGIVKSLEARKCLIPQNSCSAKQKNVVRGSFRTTGKTSGQQDWAVLCARGERSSILIFWNASTNRVSKIAPMVNADSYRSISAVGKKFILEHYRAYGGTKPPPINHHGIEDGFCEKASMVHYFYRGKWFYLAGAD